MTELDKRSDKVSEDFIQFVLAQWLRVRKIDFFHVPNGGKRDKREAAKLVAMGVKAGVPDLVILLPGSIVIWVELKIEKGVLSEKQVKFHQKLNHLGWDCHIIQTSDPDRATQLLAAILQKYGVQC